MAKKNVKKEKDNKTKEVETKAKKKAEKKVENKVEKKETKTPPRKKETTLKKKTTAKKTVQKPKAKKVTKTAKATETVKNTEKDRALKVLFVTSEAEPFVRTGGLGDVAGSLPFALKNNNVDIRVVMPLYEDIPIKFRQTMEYLGNIYVSLAWRYQYCGVFRSVYKGVTYYFIDNEYYFKRKGIYGHFDDAERFAFFARAVLDILPTVNFKPDVIHANDWQSALTPVFLDAFYRDKEFYKYIRTIFTIHNLKYQGKFSIDVIKDIIGLEPHKTGVVEYNFATNFLKGALESALYINTVSPTYANEIFNPYYGEGLESVLQSKSNKISGILNGIDTEIYNPKTDNAIVKNYDNKSIKDKEENKKKLMEVLNLPYSKDVPVIGVITRLTEQKGIDLIVESLDRLMQKDIRLVILGKGDWQYENALSAFRNKYPGKIGLVINFSTDMASKIYAGSDLFLMPSKFEPCGISQMIAMRYGTIPIVRETGGLKDTVEAFNPETKKGVGFTFYDYNANEMIRAIERAIDIYKNGELWGMLVQNAMAKDFSWDNSAKSYIELYERI